MNKPHDLEWYAVTAIMEDMEGKTRHVRASNQEEADTKGKRLFPQAKVLMVRAMKGTKA